MGMEVGLDGESGGRGREVGERGREVGIGYPPVHPLSTMYQHVIKIINFIYYPFLLQSHLLLSWNDSCDVSVTLYTVSVTLSK